MDYRPPTDHLDDSRIQGESGHVSRREFLKIAGVTGVALGAAAGMGGILAACGEEAATTTTAAASATTAAAQTTTTAAAASTTTVSAAAETGREIKLGFCTPQTGPLASFGVPDDYCVGRWREAIGEGMVLGDGKMHPISVEVQDTQSDSNRASQVAGDLINNTNVDLMMVASTPETVKPTVDQCEAFGVPVVSTDCPWQTYLGKSFENGYKWSYHVFFGGEDLCAVTLEAFNQVPSNKVVGGIFSNEASGNFFREVLPPYLEANGGYTVEVGDTVQLGTEDYTAVIAAFKRAGAELLTGNMYPPDFTNFYKQAIQQAWQPKVPFCSKATLFPQSVDALGEVGNGVMKELWWHRTFPFKSSLSGETCAELADDFEAKTGKQQTSPLLHYVVGEMAVYALKNATDPTNKDSILAAVETMKVDTIVGSIDFTAPILTPLGPKNTDFPAGPGHKRKNVYDHGLAGAQWIMTPGSKFAFTEVVTGNAAAPYLTSDLLNPIQPVPIAK